MPHRIIRRLGWQHGHLVVAVLFGALAMICLSAWLTCEGVNQMQEDARGLSLTSEVIHETGNIVGDLVDAETGQRGYLLTGRLAYLEPYNRAAPTIAKRLDHLQRLADHNGVQGWHWKVLRELTGRKLGELKETILVYRIYGPAAAKRIVLSDDGKHCMDLIRAEVTAMQGEERAWQAARQQGYRDHFAQLKDTLFVALFVSLLPVALLFFLEAGRLNAAAYRDEVSNYD